MPFEILRASGRNGSLHCAEVRRAAGDDAMSNIYDSLPTSEDTQIWDIWLSSNYLPTVTVADELGILKSLSEAPCGYEELAERLGFDLRATKTTLRLLAA